MTYLFLGKELFLKKQDLGRLKSSVLRDDRSGLNYDEFQAGEDDINKAIDCAKTVPFMAKSRLIIINEANRLNPQEKEALALLIESNPQAVNIALMAEILAPTDTLYKAVSKHGKIKKYDTLNPDKLYQWVTAEFLKFDKKAHPAAVKVLIENTGASLLDLRQAIELVATFVGEEPAVNVEDVQRLTGKSIDATAFQLVDAIVDKNADLALRILNGLDKDIKTVSSVIGLIGWHLRRLWRGEKLISKRLPASTVAFTLGVRQDKANSFFRQLNVFTSAELEKYFKALLKIDKDIKSTPINPYRALELLIIRLCA